VPHTFFRIHPTSKLAGILRFSSKNSTQRRKEKKKAQRLKAYLNIEDFLVGRSTGG
jgi:hypothetical protein